MHLEESVVINQPVEKVFNYVADPVNLPEWQGPPTEIRDLRQTEPGQLRKGDRFTTVLKFLGQQYETPTEVTAYEPNRRLSCRGTGGPVPTEITFSFEEAPGKTRFTQGQEIEPGGFFRLAGPLFERAAKVQLRNDVETLKNLLETHGYSDS
ncbi:MAG: SRPBCC family protein [Actinomycetota bacterium]|nr:SRPBCC family protein [Actinomycetota bacterium]